MKDFMWLVRHIVLTTFKDYKSWLLYVGLPVVAVVFAVLTQGNSVNSSIDIAIINHDEQHFITEEAISFIGNMNVVVKEVQEADINKQITSGELDAVFIFPNGFSESILAEQPLSPTISAIKGSEVASYLKHIFNQYMDNLVVIADAAAGHEQTFKELYTASLTTTFSTEQIQDQSTHYRKANQTFGYLIIIMLFSAANLSTIMIKERETRTFYRIIAAPIKTRSYVLSNLFVNMIVMLTQIIIILFALKYVFHINTGVPFSIMLLALLIFSLVSISFSLSVVALTRTKLEASGLQSIIFIPTSILAGCMFPIEIMPSFIEKIAYFLPQYWLLDTFSKLQTGSTFEDSAINLIILIAFAATFVLFAILKLSKSNDSISHI